MPDDPAARSCRNVPPPLQLHRRYRSWWWVSFENANRVLGADILVQRFWQEQGLGSVVPGDVVHAGFYPMLRRAEILLSRVFTRSARFMHHQNFGHRVSSRRPEFADRQPLLRIPTSVIEAARGLGADERASSIPSRSSAARASSALSNPRLTPRNRASGET